MRTILFMLGALAVSAGGFYAYVRTQGPAVRAVERADGGVSPQVIDRDAGTAGAVGPSGRPWVKVFDSQKRLSYRFRAGQFEPERNGPIHVKDAEAEFFQYVRESKDPADPRTRTQRIQIVGKGGQVEVQQGPQASADKGFDRGGAAGPPKRGQLNDVVIRIYPTAASARPSITIDTPNVAFDNETFEIATKAYTAADGTHVPADQVPIVATGDYEFKGRGLTLRWNDLDGRLELLEIAHGEYLYVRDPAVLKQGGPFGSGGGTGSPSHRESPAAPPRVGAGVVSAYGPAAAHAGVAGTNAAGTNEHGPLTDADGRPLALAAADKSAAAAAARGGKPGRAQPAKPKKAPQPPYRAAFEQDVRIAEGVMGERETELARADVMNIEFMSGSASSDKATTRPSTKPATVPAAMMASAPAPVSEVPAAVTAGAAGAAEPEDASSESRASAAEPETKPAKAGTRPAATQPAQEPLIIRWAGKLRITPIDSVAGVAVPLKPGESVLRLVGLDNPVRLGRQLSRVDCTAADYFSADGSVQVRGSERHGPVVLRQLPDEAMPPGQSRQATIVTESLNYSGASKVATLYGRSTAQMVLPQQPTTRPSTPGSATQPGDPAILATVTTRPAQVVNAAWTREGRLRFKDGLAGDMTFDRADFEGDVDVRHPQLALKSQQLAMLFEEQLKPTTRATGDAGGPAATRPTTTTTKPSSQTNLKELIATTGVWADLVDQDGRKQTVTTDRLTVRTATDADGKPYPRLVTANGNAHAFDDKQDLRAGNVELTLGLAAKPATRPATKPAAAELAEAGEIDAAAVELTSMRAWDGVVVRNVDGATAAAGEMAVRIVDGQPLVRLEGAPLAAVTDPKGSTIVGPTIDLDPKRQWAMVTGRGSIRAVQPDDAKPTTRPATGAVAVVAAATQPAKPRFMDVAWEQQAEMDGTHDRITVLGPVRVSSTSADETVNTATGKRAVIELADKPAEAAKAGGGGPATRPVGVATASAAATVAGGGARPTTGPAARLANRPTTKPTGVAGLAGSGGMDLLKDKVVSAVTLEEDAVVSSTLSDASGILRAFELRSEKVRYEAGDAATARAVGGTTRPAAAPLALTADGEGRLIVPGPGRMIFRDHRPTTAATKPTTRPVGGQQQPGRPPAVAATPASAPPAASPAPDQARGATAFQWTRSLTYDQAARKATVLGDVVIAHRPDAADGVPVQVQADQAVALFGDKPPATRPATSLAGKPAVANKAADDESGLASVQLKRLSLAGHLSVFRAGSEVSAESAEYDPASGWLVALGSRTAPARYADSTGQQAVLADQIHWNAQTWMTKFVNIRGRSGTDRPVIAPRR